MRHRLSCMQLEQGSMGMRHGYVQLHATGMTGKKEERNPLLLLQLEDCVQYSSYDAYAEVNHSCSDTVQISHSVTLPLLPLTFKIHLGIVEQLTHSDVIRSLYILLVKHVLNNLLLGQSEVYTIIQVVLTIILIIRYNV